MYFKNIRCYQNNIKTYRVVYIYYMRRACLADFIGDTSKEVKKNGEPSIQKNQKEYGHKKRIKP